MRSHGRPTLRKPIMRRPCVERGDNPAPGTGRASRNDDDAEFLPIKENCRAASYATRQQRRLSKIGLTPSAQDNQLEHGRHFSGSKSRIFVLIASRCKMAIDDGGGCRPSPNQPNNNQLARRGKVLTLWGCYAPDTISGTGKAAFAWSRILNVYRPCGSTSTA